MIYFYSLLQSILHYINGISYKWHYINGMALELVINVEIYKLNVQFQEIIANKKGLDWNIDTNFLL